MSLHRKDILGSDSLSRHDISEILKLAALYKSHKKTPKPIPGLTVANLFFEPSTRTRVSFELAAKRFGATVINIHQETSSLQKGEDLLDTTQTLKVLGINLIIIRYPKEGVPHFLARHIDIPIINGGDGCHEHPTQALLDLFTIQEHFKRLKGLSVLIVGDIAHSRVARSNIIALKKMGAKVILCAPPTLVSEDFKKQGAQITYNLDDVLPKADVVMTLRMQFERLNDPLPISLETYQKFYRLDEERLKKMKKTAIIMHPSPMNRGTEITSEVADHPRSIILEQAKNGLYVRMACIEWLLKGKKHGSSY